MSVYKDANVKLMDVVEFIHESNKIEGVKDYHADVEALRAFLWLCMEDDISLSLILATHDITMQQHLGLEAGRLRQGAVTVGNRACPSPHLAGELLHNWVLDQQEHPPKTEDECKALHVRFEHIHPFVDGNGRVGRMLWQWHRLNAGLPVKVLYAKDRRHYYNWFRDKPEHKKL